MSKRRALVACAAAVAAAGLAVVGAAGSSAAVSAGSLTTVKAVTPTVLAPQLEAAPASSFVAKAPASAPCVLPDGSGDLYFHCYSPQQIRAAYGVDNVAPLPSGEPNYGQGQTIVLVDSYGSPTAAADLQHFHTTFFPNLPAPKFQEIYPLGNPPYQSCNGNGSGRSGQCAAAGWTGEATLDIEWAYSIAPEANIILLAVPPAETLGVQGFPNLFKAISGEISKLPAGTMFSMSLAATEQTFGSAAATQAAKFDAVFKQGLAKHDNFFAAAGDTGTVGAAKQKGESTTYSYPTVGWPSSSPYVVSVGGTQLMYGWTWDPTSNTAFTSTGLNPAYFHSTVSAVANTQAVWNESWAPIGTGGGVSAIYPRPSWQANVDPGLGNHRILPDTSWNAAVNGGVDVYITAYPEYNCGNSTGCWTFYGGTSAATPQTAALVALANAARTAEGKSPLGFLDPILYDGVGASSAYTDIVPRHLGSAPATFAGSDVGVAGTVTKSAGDLVDNQMWNSPVKGYPTTAGYDATTGWGAPYAPAFVADLAAQS
ncbi:MAG TPA: S53 family peptidase [Trebonia sp.]|nr:S53 family peptidase [Trebonia sp.]